ncbi:MAG: hypothetical protein IT210_02665 [Armatimonadetes bacterium]|nr:hypothetical protein [Armatimonadota bacterium]
MSAGSGPQPKLPHPKLWASDRELYSRFKAEAKARGQTLPEAAREGMRLYIRLYGGESPEPDAP